jgi:serpin B
MALVRHYVPRVQPVRTGCRPYRMVVLRRLVTVGMIAAAAACGTQTPAPPPPPPPVPVAHQVTPDVAVLVDGINAFGTDLLGAPVLRDRPNLVVSPVSVALALRMVAVGAAGRTAQDMAAVLHQPTNAVEPVQDLLRVFSAADVKVANTVWTQQGLNVKPAYTETLRTRFAASLNDADFRRDAEAARQRINKTVADQTNGRITDLFPPRTLDDSTRMVLTNAVHMAAAWAREFPTDLTRPAPFTRADGSTVSVQMMHNRADQDDPDSKLGYAEGSGYRAVTLPYRGGALAFTVILPTGGATTDTLDAKTIAAITKQIRPQLVTLAMPKFTTRSTLTLNEPLKALGMASAFDDADFSGITTDEPLAVQTVQHDTFIQVDEHGTVAAAASGVGMKATSAAQPRTVVVDRPFVFVVTDTATGAQLFLGRITDPTAVG